MANLNKVLLIGRLTRDPESRAIADWGVRGYPTSLLIGRDGTIRWRRDGMIHTDDPELAKQLDAALAQDAG